MPDLQTDIAIIGGGLGGVAAALAACDAGQRVVLTEATRWLGGQLSSQGVSALDEHRYIEQFGGTRSYMALRSAIRQHYRDRYGVATMPDGMPLNPGDAWVSDLCFEPAVGAAVIDAMLAPHVAAGRLVILRETQVQSVDISEGRIVALNLLPALPVGEGSGVRGDTLHATMVLDATDTGELLPLAGVDYVVGAEARGDTGEALAPVVARPGEVQGFTYCFAVEYCAGENHTIAPPPDYGRIRDAQPFTLTLTDDDGSPRPFAVFARGGTGLSPFWTYRRLMSAEVLGVARDLALINWNSNDYHDATIIDVPHAAAAAAHQAAKHLSLAFLYWLQTACPRDDGGGTGYPELRLVPEVMGSADGLSLAPYIRESRRIIARHRIVADEILAVGKTSARAQHHADSVGIGWYFMDLHPAPGNPRSHFAPTLPFQIPLGALIPQTAPNLLPACKNIGTTHLSNGAYRLHPVEWTIGEAAGLLAAHCLQREVSPQTLHADGAAVAALQEALVARGVPLAWVIDVPDGDPLFAVVQRLAVAGFTMIDRVRNRQLTVDLDAPVNDDERAWLADHGWARGGATLRAIVGGDP